MPGKIPRSRPEPHEMVLMFLSNNICIAFTNRGEQNRWMESRLNSWFDGVVAVKSTSSDARVFGLYVFIVHNIIKQKVVARKFLTVCQFYAILFKLRGIGTVGSALALQARGHRFKSDILHQMDSNRILKIAEKYFVEYFGDEYKGIISERLGNTSLFLVNSRKPDNAQKELDNYINVMRNFVDNQVEIFLRQKLQNMIDNTGAGRGQCYVPARRNAKGELEIKRRAVIVSDSKYVNEDQTYIHELLHAITVFILNNEYKNGIYGEYNDITEVFNECLIDYISIEITKRIHADGILLNEKVKPRENSLKGSMYQVVAKDMTKFFETNMDVLKPALLKGDFTALNKSIGGEKEFKKIVSDFVNKKEAVKIQGAIARFSTQSSHDKQ